jgi:hypothetical protein
MDMKDLAEEEYRKPETEETLAYHNWTDVSRGTRREMFRLGGKTVIGTKDDDEDLQAGEKTAWLYIGRLKDGNTTETERNYLAKSSIKGDIGCDEIQKRGETTAFKVGIHFCYLQEVEVPDFWPKGVLVHHFRFWRQNYEAASLDAQEANKTNELEYRRINLSN